MTTGRARAGRSAEMGEAPGELDSRTNDFGLGEALGGLVAGFLLASVGVAVLEALDRGSGHGGPSSFATDAVSLAGLWAGFFGGAIVASRHHRGGPRVSFAPDRSAGRSWWAGFCEDYGLALHPWPDIPLGIGVGLASQYLLVPALELPLLPFVPHLFHRLGGPAQSLAGGAKGTELALLGVLVCVGSPFFEELFFRGLLLRALGGRLGVLGDRLGPVLAMALTGVVFGLVHFEALQLLGLVGFGVVLCGLAWRTGRLGPGIVAHAAFNAATFVAIALGR